MTAHDARTVRDTLRIGQTTKAALVAVRRQRADLMPIVEHRRDGDVVAVVHASGPNEVDGSTFPARSTAIGALGFHSDEIRVTLEMVNQVVAPDAEALPLPAGELYRRLREDPTSTVQESLVAIGVRARHGQHTVDAEYVPYAYTEVPGGVAVRWLEPEAATASGAPSAIVDDLIRMLSPSPLQQLFVDLLSDGEEDADAAVLDHATARAITRQFQHQVMLSA